MRRLLVLLLATFLMSCDMSLCSNELIEDVTSPTGKYIASVFERNCGATTPYVRVLSLRSSGEKFDPDDDDDWVFTVHGQSDVQVSWMADNKLKVSYAGIWDQLTRREKWKDVIEPDRLPRPGRRGEKPDTFAGLARCLYERRVTEYRT